MVCWINHLTRVLHIFNLVDADQDEQDKCRCIRALDINGHIHIVFTALEDLGFLTLLQGWMQEGDCVAFLGVVRVIARQSNAYTRMDKTSAKVHGTSSIL